jgi:sporulation protein YlmC with PRC-barrel domain
VLLSELKGAKLDCRGTTCGRVDDVVLEMNSGMVAFVSIDPDQNFLGVGDTKRLAPWSVVSIGADGKVRVDAQKEMMLSTTKTPDDITTLNRSGDVDAIYNAYQVPARDYDRWRDEDYNYRYDWRREREMWRRNQNYQDAPGNPNAKSTPTPSGQQPPR